MNCLFIGEQRGNNDSPYSSEEPEVDIFSPGGWACQRLGYSVDDVYHIACKDLVNSSLLVGGGLGEGGRRYYNCACPHLEDSLFQDENAGTDDIFADQNATSCEATMAGTEYKACPISICWDAKQQGKVVDMHRMDSYSNVILDEHFSYYNLELCGFTLAHKSGNGYATKSLPEMLGYAVGYLTGIFVQLILSCLFVRLCCMVRH
jgi:hypothetical protein